MWSHTFTTISRADSRLAPNQWETSLQSNPVSHWLGANLESALISMTDSGSFLHLIDELVQERRNSIANALELHLSCTNPSTYSHSKMQSKSHIIHTVLLSLPLPWPYHHLLWIQVIYSPIFFRVTPLALRRPSFDCLSTSENISKGYGWNQLK